MSTTVSEFQSSAWSDIKKEGPNRRHSLFDRWIVEQQGSSGVELILTSIIFFTCAKLFVGSQELRSVSVSIVGVSGYNSIHPNASVLCLVQFLRLIPICIVNIGAFFRRMSKTDIYHWFRRHYKITKSASARERTGLRQFRSGMYSTAWDICRKPIKGSREWGFRFGLFSQANRYVYVNTTFWQLSNFL